MRERANITIAIREKVRHLLSLRMLYIMILAYIFKDTHFWNVNISKIVRAIPKNTPVWLYSVICNWMGPLWVLYSVTLTTFFKVNFFKWLFWQGQKKKPYHCHQIGSQVFVIKWCHCECCISWHWPTVSRSW